MLLLLTLLDNRIKYHETLLCKEAIIDSSDLTKIHGYGLKYPEIIDDKKKDLISFLEFLRIIYHLPISNESLYTQLLRYGFALLKSQKNKLDAIEEMNKGNIFC